MIFSRVKNIGPTRIVEGSRTQSSLGCDSEATLAAEVLTDQTNRKSQLACHPHLHSAPVLPSKQGGLRIGTCSVQVVGSKEMRAL